MVRSNLRRQLVESDTNADSDENSCGREDHTPTAAADPVHVSVAPPHDPASYSQLVPCVLRPYHPRTSTHTDDGSATVVLRADGCDVECEPDRKWSTPTIVDHEAAYTPCTVMRDELMERFGSNARTTFRIASDCTGADGPYHAWASFSRVCPMDECIIENMFGSEAPLATHAHRFIELNSNCVTLYDDMTARDPAVGGPVVFTHAESGDARMPAPYLLDSYHSSFTCQDSSLRNLVREGVNFGATPSECGMDENTSTRTLMASIRTIQVLKPRTCTLENVCGLSAEVFAKFLDVHLPEWIFAIFIMNAADFKTKAERQRLHADGCLRVAMLLPPPVWRDIIMRCRTPRHATTLDDCLLDDDSPEVVLELKRQIRLRLRKHAQQINMQDCNDKWLDQSRSCRDGLLELRRLSPGSLASTDPLTHHISPGEHEQSLRDILAEDSAASPGGWERNPVLTVSDWSPIFPRREHELVRLWTLLAEHNGCADTALLDTREAISQTRTLAPHLGPTKLRGHGIFSLARRRKLVGAEELVQHGFSRSSQRRGISNAELSELVGNVLSVHAHAVHVIVLACCVDFTTDISTLLQRTPCAGAHAKCTVYKIEPHPHTAREFLDRVPMTKITATVKDATGRARARKGPVVRRFTPGKSVSPFHIHKMAECSPHRVLTIGTINIAKLVKLACRVNDAVVGHDGHARPGGDCELGLVHRVKPVGRGRQAVLQRVQHVSALLSVAGGSVPTSCLQMLSFLRDILDEFRIADTAFKPPSPSSFVLSATIVGASPDHPIQPWKVYHDGTLLIVSGTKSDAECVLHEQHVWVGGSAAAEGASARIGPMPVDVMTAGGDFGLSAGRVLHGHAYASNRGIAVVPVAKGDLWMVLPATTHAETTVIVILLAKEDSAILGTDAAVNTFASSYNLSTQQINVLIKAGFFKPFRQVAGMNADPSVSPTRSLGPSGLSRKRVRDMIECDNTQAPPPGADTPKRRTSVRAMLNRRSSPCIVQSEASS